MYLERDKDTFGHVSSASASRRPSLSARGEAVRHQNWQCLVGPGLIGPGHGPHSEVPSETCF